ncbi:hypothetical protein FHR34_007727 [Kitasatospora kifunensis]|uniref:Uncharacterized protein n=1 Tax=Kitasatospora kifunensis TaxID=58351 RepID=A0A7W7RAU8_KITKI|nr:hypothetical protein [Kitasatospora kifunensis]
MAVIVLSRRVAMPFAGQDFILVFAPEDEPYDALVKG